MPFVINYFHILYEKIMKWIKLIIVVYMDKSCELFVKMKMFWNAVVSIVSYLLLKTDKKMQKI